MNRYPDWAARLEVWLFKQNGRKFQYGSWDCCLFVCEAIREMTGSDPGADFRGRYCSATTAEGFLRQKFGKPSLGAMTEAVAAKFGMPEIPVRFARRGDVVLLKRARGASLGLVALDGARVLVLAGDRGMGSVPRFAGIRAWSV